MIDQDEGSCHQDSHDQVIEHEPMIANYRRTTHKAVISTRYEISKLNNSVDTKGHLTDLPSVSFFYLVELDQIDQAIGQEGPVAKNIVDRGYMRKGIGIKDGMNQGHDGPKDTNKSKILLEASLGSQKNYPHSHPTMIEGQAL